MIPPRVLVLDGQTNQSLACVRSLGRAGCTVYVASPRWKPLAAWSRYSRESFRLSGETPQAMASLRTWAVQRQIEMVFPVSERACLLCNADREAWESAGVTVACGSSDMLAQAFDKKRTVQVASACGVAVPETRSPETLEGFHAAAEDLGFPLVVKPRFSNPWQRNTFLPDIGVTYVSELNGLRQAVLSRRQAHQWPLLQRYVPGTGKGIFVLANHGNPIAWFAHRRLRDVEPSGSGSSLRRSAPLDPRLLAPAQRLLRAMQWHGPAMLEFRDDGEHAPWLIEVNGRFWGSLQLAIAAGVDFPALWLRLLRGERVQPIAGYRHDVTVRWLWGDIKRFLYILRGRPADYPGVYPTLWEALRELLGPQPPGTQLEVWDPEDRWPMVGELVQGLATGFGRRRAAQKKHPAPSPAFSHPTGVEHA